MVLEGPAKNRRAHSGEENSHPHGTGVFSFELFSSLRERSGHTIILRKDLNTKDTTENQKDPENSETACSGAPEWLSQ